MRVSVTFSSEELTARDKDGAAVVVIDVFRASTSILRALASGAVAVYPTLDVGEAFAHGEVNSEAILAGERGGVKVEGFDLGNSPREFIPEAVSGRDIIMTTTNGTKTLLAAGGAAEVFVTGFVNVSATAEAMRDAGRVIIACSGTEGTFSIEDALAAGFLVGRLSESYDVDLDDSALFALSGVCSTGDIAGMALAGQGAQNVRDAGLEDDLDICIELDSIPILARVERDPLRIIIGDGTGKQQ